MGFRIASGVAALLFGICAAVQYNDPDAARWIAAYGAACVVSVLAAAGRPVKAASLALGAIYLVWAAVLLPGVIASGDVTGEQGREAGGLLIAACWTLAVFAVALRRGREAPGAG